MTLNYKEGMKTKQENLRKRYMPFSIIDLKHKKEAHASLFYSLVYVTINKGDTMIICSDADCLGFLSNDMLDIGSSLCEDCDLREYEEYMASLDPWKNCTCCH